MVRQRKYIKVNGVEVYGVSFHATFGSYLMVQNLTTGKMERKGFGHGPANLERAKEAFAYLNQPPPVFLLMPDEEAIRQLRERTQYVPADEVGELTPEIVR